MAHLNNKGEVCHCGFGKFQPQVEWRMSAAQVIEENDLPDGSGEPGRPFVYDAENNAVVIGPEEGTHWHLVMSHPNLEDQPCGRLTNGKIEWWFPPREGKEQVEDALGALSEEGNDWDFTEPMATEPDPEERHHEVEISNDEPGIPTIGS